MQKLEKAKVWKRLSYSVAKELVSWVAVVFFAVGAALFINQVIIVNAMVPSGSMEDTIMTNDRIAAFRLSYVFSDPQRFHIVVFPFPDDESILFVKRIIGMPGEVVEIIDGQVFIDGSTEPLEDSFVKGVPHGNSGPFEVPEGSYFMLGDNRNNSRDSRYWNNRFVERDQILGRVILKYFPGFRLYTLENFSE